MYLFIIAIEGGGETVSFYGSFVIEFQLITVFLIIQRNNNNGNENSCK